MVKKMMFCAAQAALLAPGAWARSTEAASLGAGDALAAVCYLGAAALMGLAAAKAARADAGQAGRGRDIREMAACAFAAVGLMFLPSAALDATVGLEPQARASAPAAPDRIAPD